MKRKDRTLTYVLGAAGAALVGYALVRPAEASEPLPELDYNANLTLENAFETKTVTGYSNGKPFLLTVMDVGEGQYLRSDAGMAFLSMSAAAARAGVTIRAGSAFRSMLSQTSLYMAYIARLFFPPTVAFPGKSNHQNGTAVDVVGANGKSIGYGSAEFEWLRANAINYGWSWDEGQKVNEPWHWRYIG